MRPIVEIQFSDFTAQAMDQIANQAAKLHFMVGGQQKFAATDADGKFRVLSSGEPGTQKIELVFRGSQSLELRHGRRVDLGGLRGADAPRA